VAIRYSKYLGLIHYLGDIAVWSLSFLILISWFLGHQVLYTRDVVMLVLATGYWSVLAFYLRMYDIPRTTPVWEVHLEICKVFMLHIAIVTATVVVFPPLAHRNIFYLYWYLLSFGGILLWRTLFLLFLQYYRRIGFNYRTVVIAGYDTVSLDLRNFLAQRPSFGYRFLGFFDNHAVGVVKGTLDDLTTFVQEENVDEIYCSLSSLSQEQINRLVQLADNNMIRLKLIPDYRDIAYDRVVVKHMGHLPVITFRHEPLNNYINQLLKRGFDITFSLFVLVFILSWLGPILALAVKWSSPGPVLFLQKRSGLYNKTFWCWKFRTMRINEEANLRKTSRNDERITPIGKFLRKTNLDELPQFFNVLMGDMSVVGPRPYMLSESEYFSRQVEKYMVRHFVKPGITGLSQSRGMRGPTANAFAMRQRVKMDVFYIEKWSFLLDMQIIFVTALKMVKGDKNAF
jgi:Undecaprenyl-phosphate glucose phosphotransferase